MLMAVPPRVKTPGLYDTTMDGLIVDLFAGGGGASIGIEQAFAEVGINRHVDIAINHDPDAISCHMRNHPMTDHIQSDVFDVDPCEVTEGKPVAFLHASPDCTDFSRAKGGKPNRSVKRRSLAWVVIRWSFAVKPKIITLENVPEFEQWSELDEQGMPLRDGSCFQIFVDLLRYMGYAVEWRCLKACDYGAPTTRNRLFLIARCDGKPIIWPEATYGNTHRNERAGCQKNRTRRSGNSCPVQDGSDQIRIDQNGTSSSCSMGGRCGQVHQKRTVNCHQKKPQLKPYRTAADIIVWSEPMCSIFATPAEAKAWAKHHKRPCPRRPLADNTLKRIAAGMYRHVINATRPFIVSIANYGSDHAQTRSVNEPLSTVTASPKGGRHALVSPTLVQIGYGERAGQSPRVPGLDKPLGTIVSGGGKHALVAAFLNKHYTGVVGQTVEKPLGTITSWDHHSVGAAHIVRVGQGENRHESVTDPLSTITSGYHNKALVTAFMAKYYGCDVHGQSCSEPLHTIPTHERFGLVTLAIDGETYAIVDIMMRMLTPRELARAQGFRDDYVIDEGANGKKLSKRVQVRLIGNSVSPPPMQAIIRANVIPYWPKPAKRNSTRREAVTV